MNQSNNIQLNAKEFEDFDGIMKFLVEVTLNQDPDQFSKDAYYEAYGAHLGKLSAGTVRNQIKNSQLKYPYISSKSYGFFIEAFNKIEIGLLKDGKPTKYALYKKKFTDLKKKIDARIKNGNFIYEAENKKPTKANKSKPIAEDDNYLNIIQGTAWYCYERDDNDKISRKVLQFGTLDRSGTCPVTHTISEKGMEKWKGQAQFISGESLLVITMVNSRSKLDYTHFLIKVDNRSNALELCIGHKTFRNNENDNVVTKTVVLTLCNKETGDPTAKRFALNNETVPPQIRAFLFERHRNRLSSPHATAVFNMETFNDWLNLNQPVCEVGIDALVGTYDVYYRISPSDPNWIIDNLELKLNSSGGLEARYVHEVFEGDHKEWIGKAHPNYETKIMTLYLKDPSSAKVTSLGHIEVSDNPIFLMVNLPSRSLRKLNTLTGVAAASRDGDRGGVGRLMVLIKRGAPDQKRNIDLKKLGAFFDYFADRSWVRPPITSTVPAIYQFEHLEAAIKDAVERKRGLDSKK